MSNVGYGPWPGASMTVLDRNGCAGGCAEMRARAGDPPRTMARKSCRTLRGPDAYRVTKSASGSTRSSFVDLRLGHCRSARGWSKRRPRWPSSTTPPIALVRAVASSRKSKTSRRRRPRSSATASSSRARHRLSSAGSSRALRVARTPFCVTDDPRLAGVGGIGMLTIVVPPVAASAALATGSITMRPPRSVQVLLRGRTRPFVCRRA